MTKRKLMLATRKWKRQFNQAVAQSMAKTVTEPVTNSYDSYKRMFGADDATTGLIERILSLQVGTHLVHEELLKNLPKRPQRQITVLISTTAKAPGLEKRECQVMDQAEGMSAEEMDRKFEKYGAEKSGAGEGLAVRGLFGQGICDVVYSHTPGQIRSIKGDRASICDFGWDGPPGQEEPVYEASDLGRATRRHRQEWAIPAGNGTNVSFVLDEVCRVPSPENLLVRLSGFYMLRLINADPYCSVILHQARGGGVHEQRLTYNFPRGQVIGKFQAEIKYRRFNPIIADVVVLRAETTLPTKEAGDDRANGLLIVDEVDTVYDQTLFSFDSSPYLDQVYGAVRLRGVREVIRELLNAGEALLTESRDGFDTKSDFYKTLEDALKPHLEPILKKEIDRRSEPSKVLSEAAEKKVKRALQKLNDLFEDVTKQRYEGGPGGPGPTVPDIMAFEEERLQLKVGQPRRIRLLANAARIRRGSTVIADSDNVDVRIEPNSTVFERTATSQRLLSVGFTLTGSKLGSKAEILALAQDLDGKGVETRLHVVDVVPPEIAEPPASGLEFHPKASKSAPSRLGALSLLVNPLIVPVGTSIMVRKSQGDPGVKLVDANGDDQDEVQVKFAKEHLLPQGTVGRIGLSYRGYGFGQKARITADCFPRPKVNIRAEAWVSIEETKSSFGGVFKGLQYKALPGRFSKNASEFDPITGMITINRLHPVNRAAFGVDEKSFREAIDTDRPAQFRLAEVVVDQCLYHMMAVAYRDSEVLVDKEDPVGSIRQNIERFKAEVEEDVFRQFVEGFRVPRVDGMRLTRRAGDMIGEGRQLPVP